MSILIYTLGDPAGVGPELLFLTDIRALLKNRTLLIVGPESILEHYSRHYNRSRFWKRIVSATDMHSDSSEVFLIQPPGLEYLSFQPGIGDKHGGFAAGASLETACSIMGRGLARTLVTGPLNKACMLEAGFKHGGHTEFLADYFNTGPEKVCMHLCGERLRVSLVTTHPPLRLVTDLVTTEKIVHCLQLTNSFIRKLGLSAPVAVCGLNPHAGEQGRIGHEEESVIIPAIKQAKAEGINVQGPFSADTIFLRAFSGDFSAVLAMYHDQGLGPLKLVEFGKSVNVTLGLPIIRTSVDHGTGYDLAGSGQASPRSLERAFDLALCLSESLTDAGPKKYD